jgi:hypothetical protein
MNVRVCERERENWRRVEGSAHEGSSIASQPPPRAKQECGKARVCQGRAAGSRQPDSPPHRQLAAPCPLRPSRRPQPPPPLLPL